MTPASPFQSLLRGVYADEVALRTGGRPPTRAQLCHHAGSAEDPVRKPPPPVTFCGISRARARICLADQRVLTRGLWALPWAVALPAPQHWHHHVTAKYVVVLAAGLLRSSPSATLSRPDCPPAWRRPAAANIWRASAHANARKVRYRSARSTLACPAPVQKAPLVGREVGWSARHHVGYPVGSPTSPSVLGQGGGLSNLGQRRWLCLSSHFRTFPVNTVTVAIGN